MLLLLIFAADTITSSARQLRALARFFTPPSAHTFFHSSRCLLPLRLLSMTIIADARSVCSHVIAECRHSAALRHAAYMRRLRDVLTLMMRCFLCAPGCHAFDAITLAFYH